MSRTLERIGNSTDGGDSRCMEMTHPCQMGARCRPPLCLVRSRGFTFRRARSSRVCRKSRPTAVSCSSDAVFSQTLADARLAPRRSSRAAFRPSSPALRCSLPAAAKPEAAAATLRDPQSPLPAGAFDGAQDHRVSASAVLAEGGDGTASPVEETGRQERALVLRSLAGLRLPRGEAGGAGPDHLHAIATPPIGLAPRFSLLYFVGVDESRVSSELRCDRRCALGGGGAATTAQRMVRSHECLV